MTNTTQAKIITPEKLEQLRYPLPRTWLRAAGISRNKKRAIERHLSHIRKEWDKSSFKQ